MRYVGLAVAVAIGLIAGPVLAAEAGSTNVGVKELEAIGGVLIVFLVLSVVFEVALTPIFNWRVFLARFDGKGVKTPLTFLIALLVFLNYDLDIVRDVLNALDQKIDGKEVGLTVPGQIITALLIAGGSSGIQQIFSKLGIRNPAGVKKKADEAKRALAEKQRAPSP